MTAKLGPSADQVREALDRARAIVDDDGDAFALFEVSLILRAYARARYPKDYRALEEAAALRAN